MSRYVLRRLAGALPLVLGVATLVFVILALAPGDAATAIFGPNTPPEVADQLRENWGLNDPLPVRYLKWLGAVLTGDLGWSLARNEPVLDLLLSILPNTLLLSGTALALALVAGTVVGVVQAVYRGSWADRLLSGGTLFFYGMPSFWLGLMMMLLFSLVATERGWPVAFPASGMVTAGAAAMGPLEGALDVARHLVLPATTLALVVSAGLARFVRAGMVEALEQDFVRTARAKGLPERTVIFKHALRNALGPLVSLVGLYLPILFGGTVFVEVVFSWPGMGKLMVDSILQRDVPVVMAGSLLFAFMVIAGNLAADLLYGVVDPRVRQGTRG